MAIGMLVSKSGLRFAKEHHDNQRGADVEPLVLFLGHRCHRSFLPSPNWTIHTCFPGYQTKDAHIAKQFFQDVKTTVFSHGFICTLVGGLEYFLFSQIYLESSSQLTNSYFS